ncbi:MAG: bis(5'-nucleosyl)-tetraphosphatase (symmetrical) YqeK [Oscillospiraceae bacterium]
MITRKQARQLSKKNLSARRYEHTLNVEKMAIRLAKLYDEDVEAASIAALLHDIAKEKPRQELLQIIQDDAIIAASCEKSPPTVWHGAAAAVLAKREYGVDNEDILNAIRYHSTGRAGMSCLEKIIYMADMVSEERQYPEAEYLRGRVFKNLNEGTLEALRISIDWIKQDGKPLDEETVAAYEALKSFYNN